VDDLLRNGGIFLYDAELLTELFISLSLMAILDVFFVTMVLLVTSTVFWFSLWAVWQPWLWSLFFLFCKSITNLFLDLDLGRGFCVTLPRITWSWSDSKGLWSSNLCYSVISSVGYMFTWFLLLGEFSWFLIVEETRTMVLPVGDSKPMLTFLPLFSVWFNGPLLELGLTEAWPAMIIYSSISRKCPASYWW
jgi:hypothetical protein